MAIRAVVEVALHFETFRNVDLFHQGLYHLRARMQVSGENKDACFAAPSGCMATAPLYPEPAMQQNRGLVTAMKQARPDHHSLLPSHIAEDLQAYCTRCFLIRYCEEEVELNDIGLFRFEATTEQLEVGCELLLEVDLMFADLSNHGGADRFGEQPDLAATNFKAVSTQTFRVRGAAGGLHEFVPVVFDEYHFCSANLLVHSALLDFRLRLVHAPLVQEQKLAAAGLAAPTAAGVLSARTPSRLHPGVCSAEIPEGGLARTKPVPEALTAPSFTTLSFTESVFNGGSLGTGQDRLFRRAEGFFLQHAEVLAASHRRLATWTQDTLATCASPALQELFKARKNGGNQGKSEEVQVAAPLEVPEQGSYARALEAQLGPEAGRRVIAAQLARDLNAISCRIAELWYEVLNLLLYSPGEVAMRFREAWERTIMQRWSLSIVKDSTRADVCTACKDDAYETHHQVAENLRSMRKAVADRESETSAIEDESLIPKMELRPLMFEQRYTKQASGGKNELDATALPSAPKPYRGVHLFVLVHGFQGNSFDMRLMKNNLALVYPDAVFLSSTINEDSTDGDINEMGARLAQEVLNYINDWCPGVALGRLSFIVYSMGGIIARAALPHLQDFASKMYTFLTFSGPHLGIFQDKLSLFNTGFWVLKKWKNSTFLQQISMADNADPRETFLYKLSKTPGLEYFKYVVMVSCYEDQYGGPLQSARAEICSSWEGQPDKQVYMEMVRNIWANVKPERVTRFDTDFVMPEKSLDTIIGRAAHILFLECQPVMKMLVHNYSHFFR